MTNDEALKLALEALNIVKLHFTQNRHINAAIIELEQQAEQEPVACRFCHSKKGCWTWQCYNCGEIDDVQKPTVQPKKEPRQWVVLEAEDLAQIESDDFWQIGNHMAIAMAVEAKLKELNK